MASASKMEPEGVGDAEAVVPYSMHVSSKYLELTRKKLELTRLPRELDLGEQKRWELGTPKGDLEGLLDYWLEHYNWRTQESHFNTTLPQYRTTITLPPTSSPSSNTSPAKPQSLRIHFVHKRSKHPNAIPLLFCHTWPSSFIEVSKIIDALTDPQALPAYGDGATMAFHVVAPSVPGFGFSDASGREGFGVRETAEYFDGVMMRLGYGRYVAHGTGWGFSICRALAINHSQHCVAVHTSNPSFAEPTFKRSLMAAIKYRIARLTKAKISFLSFGYVPSEIRELPKSKLEKAWPTQHLLDVQALLGPTLSHLYSRRPQTLAFSLCDSPIGLLAGLLDVIHTRSPSQSPVTSRSRSPFLSPAELEMQDSGGIHVAQEDEIHPATAQGGEEPLSPRAGEMNARNYTWSPTEVLDWTMMQWLPGPEAGLRWLRRAHLDSSPESPFSTSYCAVPLGISSFRGRKSSSSNNSNSSSPPIMWGSASWRIGWVKRHQRPASLPAWEAPDLLVLDMRECFGTFLSHGIVGNLPTQAT